MMESSNVLGFHLSLEESFDLCEQQKGLAKLVHKHLNKQFQGLTHNYIALHYYSAYTHLAYKSTTECFVPSFIQK